MLNRTALPSSFRDPSGHVTRIDGEIYRFIDKSYQRVYEQLVDSGLLAELQRHGLLIPHVDTDIQDASQSSLYKVIKPDCVPLISYPYEWCFSQLKDAALLTLEINRRALERGFILKDASAYNVQFVNGRPVFIDTLSFDDYVTGSAWSAYGQFCRHFLAPLALMSYRDVRLLALLRHHMDGIPLDLCSRLLPWRSRFHFGLGIHLHLHARAQSRFAKQRATAVSIKSKAISNNGMLGLIDSLKSTVRNLTWSHGATEWFDYYQVNNNYGELGLTEKETLVKELSAEVRPLTAWDLGGNTGRFSRLLTEGGTETTCWDVDPSCVEANYQQVRSQGESHLLPLLIDLTNPSPSLGWAGEERDSLANRGPVDLVLALGLVHHLAISNNVPLLMVFNYLARLTRHLIVEFIPKDDSQVQKLLASRPDIYANYTQQSFEDALSKHFAVKQSKPIPNTLRTIYLASTLSAQ